MIPSILMLSIDPPSLEEATVKAIKQAHTILDRLADVIPNNFGEDERAELVMLFSSVAYEHFQAITMLSSHRALFGSAMALFRPLLETIIRGEWLYFCVDESTRTAFRNQKLTLDSSPFKKMAPDLDRRSGAEWLGSYAPYYGKMCDYTHTGRDAVVRRNFTFDPESVKPLESQIRALLSQSAMAVVLHFQTLCDAIGDQGKFDALKEIFTSIEVEE